MTDDPRHFALQAALRRLRVHLEQAVADNDAAIAAWDAIDDRRIDDEVEVTNFEDAEHQWQDTETGERRRGSPISAKPGDSVEPPPPPPAVGGCPVCGGPAPWHAWFNRDGMGCRCSQTIDQAAS